MAMLDQQEHRASGQINVHSVAKNHGHAHRRRSDHKWDARIVSRDNFRLTDQQFTVMDRLNNLLQSLLDDPAEVLRIRVVNPAIHETKTVGGTHDSIAMHIENGALKNGDSRKVTAKSPPSIAQLCIAGC